MVLAVHARSVSAWRCGPGPENGETDCDFDFDWGKSGCPQDDMKYAERQEIEAMRPQLTKLASTFRMSFGQLVRAVLDETLTEEQKAAVEKVLGN